MNRYFYICLVGLVLSCVSCFKDDTNTSYRQLVKPVLVNDEKLPELFIENHVYSVKYGEDLVITPGISYENMDDLEYEWRVDGKTISTTKDFRWTCDISDRSVGTFLIRRKSAGNADVYGFTIALNQPYERGWAVLTKDNGELRLHFLQEIIASPEYEYEEWYDALGRSLSYSKPIRVMEFWSTETSSVKGELLYLDEDPAKCVNMNGLSFGETVRLQEEFRNETFPEGLQVKDAMYCGFVSYILDTSGKLYQRKAGYGYYTGQFSERPVQFEGKELKVSALMPCAYPSKMALIYDSGNGRFLLVETDYAVKASESTGKKAGQILEFPDNSGLNTLTGQELAWSSFLKPKYSYEPTYSYFCILKGTDGMYRARQFQVEYDGDVLSGVTNDFKEVVFPGFGADSKICVLNDEYMGMIQPCIYFTKEGDPYSLWSCTRSEKGLSSPTLYKKFDSPIVGLDHSKLSRTASYLGVALKNGDLMIFNLTKDYMKETDDSLVKTWHGLGEIVELNYKYGNVSNV